MSSGSCKFSAAHKATPFFVLRRVALAYGIYAAGFLTSAAVRSAGRRLTLEDGIMSDLLSRTDNPRGCFISASAAVLWGLLLLPTVALLQRGYQRLQSRWGVLGGWIYCVGLIAVIATGISTPFQRPYVPIHLYLAFLAFMSLVAGLAICHGVIASLPNTARLQHAGGALLLMGAFLFLTYLFFTPRYFDGRRWFLAVSEWGLAAVIAASTVSITAVMVEWACRQEDSCEEGRATPDAPPNGSQPIRSEANSTSSAAGSRR
jgi:hypothetical protein